MRIQYISYLFLVFTQCKREEILFSDDFSEIPQGPLASKVGAHTEYHYVPGVPPKGHWIVSTFRYNLPPEWYIRRSNNKNYIIQTAINEDSPIRGILYKPESNPLYNYSNYQATLSLPGWKEDMHKIWLWGKSYIS